MKRSLLFGLALVASLFLRETAQAHGHGRVYMGGVGVAPMMMSSYGYAGPSSLYFGAPAAVVSASPFFAGTSAFVGSPFATTSFMQPAALTLNVTTTPNVAGNGVGGGPNFGAPGGNTTSPNPVHNGPTNPRPGHGPGASSGDAATAIANLNAGITQLDQKIDRLESKLDRIIAKLEGNTPKPIVVPGAKKPVNEKPAKNPKKAGPPTPPAPPAPPGSGI